LVGGPRAFGGYPTNDARDRSPTAFFPSSTMQQFPPRLVGSASCELRRTRGVRCCGPPTQWPPPGLSSAGLVERGNIAAIRPRSAASSMARSAGPVPRRPRSPGINAFPVPVPPLSPTITLQFSLVGPHWVLRAPERRARPPPPNPSRLVPVHRLPVSRVLAEPAAREHIQTRSFRRRFSVLRRGPPRMTHRKGVPASSSGLKRVKAA